MDSMAKLAHTFGRGDWRTMEFRLRVELMGIQPVLVLAGHSIGIDSRDMRSWVAVCAVDAVVGSAGDVTDWDAFGSKSLVAAAFDGHVTVVEVAVAPTTGG